MFSGMLIIFAPLVIGYLFPINNQTLLNRINKLTSQLVSVILLLMGLSLAALDNLSENMNQILLYTAVFFSIISICNLIALPIIDKIWPTKTSDNHKRLPFLTMALESLKLMFIVAFGLIVGIMSGFDLDWVDTASELILLVLLLFIGIQLRNSGMSLKQILLNKQGLTIAAVIILSSLPGGLIAAYFLDLPMNIGLAMASGFGWYSLTGILMTDAVGPVLGGAAFLNELLRELVALSIIPMLIARYPNTAIGYAGATAMDFTLPVIQNCGGIKCVPVAIVSGFILSLMVPFLILFFVSL